MREASEKLNKCNQCDYESSHTGHLRVHLLKHSGDKPNKCNQCDFASSLAGNLKTHLKIHSGEKSNKCNQCDFASSYASALRRHLKIHSGEKSNKCNQCDFASSQASNLRAHLKTTFAQNCCTFRRTTQGNSCDSTELVKGHSAPQLFTIRMYLRPYTPYLAYMGRPFCCSNLF